MGDGLKRARAAAKATQTPRAGKPVQPDLDECDCGNADCPTCSYAAIDPYEDDAMPDPGPAPDPIEVHLNTRDCEPMQPETAAALGRAFQAAHKQLSDSPDPAAILRRLEELKQSYRDSCTIEDVRSLDNALHDLLATDLIPVVRRAVELEGENARLRESLREAGRPKMNGESYERCWCRCLSERCMDEPRCQDARAALAAVHAKPETTPPPG